MTNSTERLTHYSAAALRQQKANKGVTGCMVVGLLSAFTCVLLLFVIGSWAILLFAGILVILVAWAIARGEALNAEVKEVERTFAAQEEKESRARDRRQVASIRRLVTKHRKALLLKRAQLTPPDEYGRRDTSDWERHCDYFLDKVVAEELGEPIEGPNRHLIHALLGDMQPEQKDDVEAEGLSGRDYELYCADLLKSAGWSVIVTRASQDQGVDIVGTCNGMKAVIQCKRHGNSIGNGAVQEVLAAKAFEDADYAVVVSTAAFTKSAKSLAAKVGVQLVHHSQLSDLAEIITTGAR